MRLTTMRVRRGALVLLPAACLLLALGVYFGAGPRVALGQVLEKMRQARTMVCDIMTTITTPEGTKTYPGRLMMSAETGDVIYEDDRSLDVLSGGVRTSFSHGQEILRVKLPDGAEKLFPGPDEWLRRLLAMSGEADTRLPEQVIDGRPALGFEMAAWKLGHGARPHAGSDTPAGVAQLWVDPATRLPVRFVVQTPGWHGQDVTIVYENLRFDVPLELPADEGSRDQGIKGSRAESERAAPASVGAEGTNAEQTPDSVAPTADSQPLEMPPITEASFLDGLRKYRELVQRTLDIVADLEIKAGDDEGALEGLRNLRALLPETAGWPERLDGEWFGPQIAALLGVHVGRAKAAGAMDTVREIQAEGLQVMPASLFYRQLLLEQRDPEYFGGTVQPDDADAVLLRYKLPDGRSRVIYNDLRAETLE